MVTKLKKLSYSKSLQVLVFITTVVVLCVFSFILMQSFSKNDGQFTISYTSKSIEEKLDDENHNIRYQLLTLASYYKNENHIKSGATITNEKVEDKKLELFEQKSSAINQLLIRQQQYGDIEGTEINDQKKWAAFEENYSEEIADIPNQIILDDLYNYRILTETINGHAGVNYWIYGDDFQYSNVDSPTQEYFKNFTHNYAYTENKGVSAYQTLIAYDEEYVRNLETQTAEENMKFNQILQWFRIICLTFLACLFYLIITTGHRSEDDIIHLSPIDKIYVEFSLGLLLSAFILVCYIVSLLLHSQFDYVLLLTVESILIALGLALFLSLIRHLKNLSFWQNSILGILISRLFGFLYEIFTGGTLMLQVIGTIAVLGLITMIPFAGIITIPLGLWLAFNWVNRFNQISFGVEKVKNGDYNAKIEIDRPREFKILSDNINQIAHGLNREVESRIKSERLKTDLISNVSHDIRTPLTSIITYIDLLKNEKIDNTEAQHYIEIIQQKSDRLKILIDDLFEASKASSGNIPVTLEKVDIVSLIRQGLGELDDKVQASTLDFKINIPQNPVYVWADGRLLWRVLENLLANVLKYSLENSRIYMDLKENEFMVAIEIKNISAYELNVAENELMERFKRGDESRHSEGSGLGLSIARSLMLSQNGNLNIIIDGDLFKAIVNIPKIYDENKAGDEYNQ